MSKLLVRSHVLAYEGSAVSPASAQETIAHAPIDTLSCYASQ